MQGVATHRDRGGHIGKRGIGWVGHGQATGRRLARFLLLPVGLGGCQTTGPLSTLDPQGPQAALVARLWWIMAGGAVVVFVLVMAALAVALLAPTLAARLSPPRWIVAGGLIFPLVLLVPLTAGALVAGDRIYRLPVSAQPLRVEAIARQWDWRFRYPDHPDIPESDTLRIPAGETVQIEATSEDVIHSFWVPQLGGKIDATPGRIARLLVSADRPGDHIGLCSEYCGLGHDRMPVTVQVMSPDDFARWIGGPP